MVRNLLWILGPVVAVGIIAVFILASRAPNRLEGVPEVLVALCTLLLAIATFLMVVNTEHLEIRRL
jgi:hypothetical protein